MFAQNSVADIDEQRRGGDDPLPKVVVMLDRWETFMTTLAEVDGGAMMDAVTRILREGASVGVHLVVTGDRTLANHRVSSLTECKFTLRLADRSDYSLVGISPKAVPDEMPAGRGFAAGGVEAQVMLLAADPDGRAQATELGAIGAAARERVGELSREERPFRLDVLPSRVTVSEALALRETATGLDVTGAAAPLLLVGVGGDELTAYGVDPRATSSFMVAGPPRSGRSTVLQTAVSAALGQGACVVVLAPRPSPLRDLAGTPGVLGVFTETSTPLDTVTELLESAGDGPVVVVLDDAEEMKDCPVSPLLMQLVRSAGPVPACLLFAGAADALQVGFSGWHVEARKARRGMLLSPQGMSDGELIGVRLPRSTIGGNVQPGTGLLHLGDGSLTRVVTLLPDPRQTSGKEVPVEV
jgi:S-DNA-T family DNA segregation ATPase FtsK/SpoIIIE